MTRSIVAVLCFVVLLLGNISSAPGQVIEDDAALAIYFDDFYFLEARLAQGQQLGGLVAFGIEDLGQGSFEVCFQGIAQPIAGYEVQPGDVFDTTYVTSNMPLAMNDNSVNNTIVKLAIGESLFFGYWDDAHWFDYDANPAGPDPEDGYGWAEILRTASGLELVGSATAESRGIIVGTLIQAPSIPGDVNQDGAVDLLDVAPFVALLANNGFQLEADINGDGAVDLLDVGPFVDLLSA